MKEKTITKVLKTFEIAEKPLGLKSKELSFLDAEKREYYLYVLRREGLICTYDKFSEDSYIITTKGIERRKVIEKNMRPIVGFKNE